MLQSFDDGVYIHQSVTIIDEKKQNSFYFIRIVQLLVIAIGSWSSSSMLIEALSIPCDVFFVKLAVLIFSAILYGLYIIPTLDLVKLFFGLLFYGLFCFSRGIKLLNGIYIIENLVLQKIDTYYEVESFRYVADYTTQKADTTMFLVLLLLPFIAILALAVVRNRLVFISSMLLLLPAAANFALGLIPSERYLVAYVICTAYLISQSQKARHIIEPQQRRMLHNISSRAAIWLSVLCLCLFFLMKLFVSEEEYHGLTGIKATKEKMQAAIQDFSVENYVNRITNIRLFTIKTSSAGLAGGVLGTAGQIRYANSEQLRVSAPAGSIEEGIYLKGYVGSVYTGDRWTLHSAEELTDYNKLMEQPGNENFLPVNQVNRFLSRYARESKKQKEITDDRYDYSISEGNMRIEYIDANENFLYAPYFTNYELLEDIYYEKDLYAAPLRGKSSYDINYYFRVAVGEEGERDKKSISEEERAYRDFVYQTYTALPEAGLDNIKRDFSPERLKFQTDSIDEKIYYVKDFLDKNTKYSLSPGKLPEGKDFVEYFLYENKTGYCAHYASAAALMLRVMGIPTRYVEGYAFGEEAIMGSDGTNEITRYTEKGVTTNQAAVSEVTVRDYNAHAWVEVYFDYCGWLPVEFTPGSPVSYNQSVIEDLGRFSGRQIEDEASKASDITPLPEAIIPDEYQPTRDERLELKQNLSQEVDASATNSDLVYFLILLIMLLAVGFIILLVLLWLGYRRRHRGSLSERAFAFYHDIEKLLIVDKELPYKNMLLEENEAYVMEHCVYIEEQALKRLMSLVRRARFGRTPISDSEFKEITDYREHLSHRIWRHSSWVKRLKIKLLLAI